MLVLPTPLPQPTAGSPVVVVVIVVVVAARSLGNMAGYRHAQIDADMLLLAIHAPMLAARMKAQVTK
jgi:hypothetical protein